MRLLGCVLLASVVLVAGDAGDLSRKGAAEEKAAEGGWARFILAPTESSDEHLNAIVAHYEAAIDYYQRAEDAGAQNVFPAIINLARRVAKLRATLLWRDQKRKREAAAKKKAAGSKNKKTPDDQPAGKAPEPEPEPEPDAEKDKKAPAPAILETRLQRARSIQAARFFLMKHFRYRKRPTISPRCATCKGQGGFQQDRRLNPNTKEWFWPPRVICGACRGHKIRFMPEAARGALWLSVLSFHKLSLE